MRLSPWPKRPRCCGFDTERQDRRIAAAVQRRMRMLLDDFDRKTTATIAAFKARYFASR